MKIGDIIFLAFIMVRFCSAKSKVDGIFLWRLLIYLIIIFMFGESGTVEVKVEGRFILDIV